MDPVTVGLIAGGGSLFKTFTNFFGDQEKARAQNKSIIAQYKQRMKIQRIQDQARFDQYNAKVLGFDQNKANLTEQARIESMQDQLKMDEMLKGMAFQGQNDLVNESQARGRIAARGVSGQSALKAMNSVSAASGRQAAARDEQMVGATLANKLREDARIRSLNASIEKQYNQVRYAPRESMEIMKPELVNGPSALSLVAGIGEAALSGVTAGMNQANFNNSLQTRIPGQGS